MVVRGVGVQWMSAHVHLAESENPFGAGGNVVKES